MSARNPFPQGPRQSDPYGPESPSRFPTARRDGGAGNRWLLTWRADPRLAAIADRQERL